MIFKKYLSETGNILKQNVLYKFIVIVIGCVTIINTFMIYYSLSHQTIVLIPPGLESKATIRGNYVSDDYLKSFAQYITWLLYSYNPTVARSQFNEVLSYFLPEQYGEVRKQFYALAEQIELSNLSSVFYIQKIQIDQGKRIIHVQGINQNFSQDGKKVSDNTKQLSINYSVINGRVYIQSIKEEEK